MNFNSIENFATQNHALANSSSGPNFRLPGQTEEQYKKRITRKATIWGIIGIIIAVIVVLVFLYILITEGPKKTFDFITDFFTSMFR